MALLYAKASDGYLASIPVNIMGFTQSRNSENSWQRLPNGILLQWGGMTWTSTTDEGTKSLTFPLTFSSIFSAIGILLQASGNTGANAVLQLYTKTTSSVTFNVQHMQSDAKTNGFQYIAIGNYTGIPIQNILRIYTVGTLKANSTVYINSKPYITNSNGEITLTDSLNSVITYTIQCGAYRDNATVTFDGKTEYDINLTTLLTYTITVAGTYDRRFGNPVYVQTLTVTYNGTNYVNTATFTVIYGSTITITNKLASGYGSDYTCGNICINGTNTGSTSYTLSNITADAKITNSAYSYTCSSDCSDSGG